MGLILIKPSNSISSKWEEILLSIPKYNSIITKGLCTFNEDEAQKAIDFFHECITHVKGPLAKKPFILGLWQQGVIGNLFGWKRPNGTRRYRKTFWGLPRKNGKSALAAGTINYINCCDNEAGAENYSAAAERKQAGLVFDQAKGMVLQDETLRNRCEIYTHSIVVMDTETGGVKSSYIPLSADAPTKHGLNPHAVVIDEVHAHPNSELIDALTTGQGARTQPLIIYISTSDYDRPSICNELWDYSCKVRDGVIDDNEFLPVIYEVTNKDNWRDEKVWMKANPNYGVSLQPDFIKSEFQKAIHTPRYENTFKRFYLNLRTEQDIRWIPLEKWDACKQEFDKQELVGRPCYSALDLASTIDIAALNLIFPEDGNKILPFFFIPKKTALEREIKARVPYNTWIKEGYIEGTEGDCIDYDYIRLRANELKTIYNIKEMAADRWNAQQIITQLGEDGIEMVPFGQGFGSMSEPSKELERMIVATDIIHDGNPVLRWMISNVSIEQDAAGNIKPSRSKSSEKIDGVVSLIMSIGRSIVRTNTTSVYEERGLLTL